MKRVRNKEGNMDKTQDLILGVLGGPWVGVNGYPGVEAYLTSIERSGYTGRKVMICWDIRPDVKAKLIQFGFEVIDLFPVWPPEPFFHARMRLGWEYLRDHSQEFRYVFWLDIKDLVLQSDPSVWMEEHIGNHSIVASTECVSIEHEETNQMWAKVILGEDRYQEIKDEEVINGGAWAGTAEAMKEVFHQVHLGCSTYGGPFPPCQIWINYVMRQPGIKEHLYIPRWSQGFAACLHPCWSPWRTPCWPHMRDPHPTLDKDTCLLYPGTAPSSSNPMIPFNNMTNIRSPWAFDKAIELVQGSSPLHGIECKPGSGKPFAIVHGYDRDWGIKSLFEYKYRFGVDAYNFDLARNEFNALSVIHRAKRSLRSPKREVLIGASKLPQPGRVFKRHP